MGRTLWLLLLFWLAVVIMTGKADGINNNFTSGGLFWSTAKEEGDLLHKAEAQDDSTTSAGDGDFDGGFSSLDGMLQWAIGHSDPVKLKERAEDFQRLSPSELNQRQMDVKELMEKLKTPSDAQLMKIAIDDLKNSSLSLEDRYRALQELLALVEPIDNANDLNKLGGLLVVMEELSNPDPDIRTIAAWILGKASQNNPVVQEQVLELGALAKLMKMVKSSFAEEAIKALYAVSALIRNSLVGQELFYAETGSVMLQDILRNASIDIRLRMRVVSLVGDLAESQSEDIGKAEMPSLRDRILLKSVVDLTASTDLDLQEKALVAIKNLLQLKTTEALVFKNFCALDDALDKMRKFLHDLMADESRRDYVMDVENLRSEVEFIFHEKLEEVQCHST
ncbi:hsp70 nucleotide exchange factor FES1-like [Quillaja saponaria]|uniref:Hsp70 nucleotide exchange factor FES1-like n=1 Tax=Quillaja saponaria TaxID=32244 RepID=A0AAD7LCY3_QUISA|nr:hsp70 nucleotide exchange factor FES1-like [Quillaja saponaria]KAJ7955538.1 hsp70 nucleotide exchange factor FES1-like [Quillaja saponaria]